MAYDRFCILGWAFVLAATSPAIAQPNYSRTKVVDPNGSPTANFTTIQLAVDNILQNPPDRWTVLIAAGTYAENVLLDDTKENIDLVGLDPDGVIIAPTSGAAITIEGSGARNNSVQNLTIRAPANGTGVVIRAAGPTGNPSNVRLDNVRINTIGATAIGIDAQDMASDLLISNTSVTTEATGSTGLRLANLASGPLIQRTTFLAKAAETTCLSVFRVPDGVTLVGCAFETQAINSNSLLVTDFGDPALRLKNLRIESCRFTANGPFSGGATPGRLIYVKNAVDAMRVTASTLTVNGGSGGGSGAVMMDFTAGANDAEYSSDIEFSNVTMRSLTQSHGINASKTVRLKLLNCDSLRHDGAAIYLAGTDTQIDNSTLITRPTPGGAPSALDDSWAVQAQGRNGLRINNSRLQARKFGLLLNANCQNVIVSNSCLAGSHYGLYSECGDQLTFVNCRIEGTSLLGRLSMLPQPEYQGVWLGSGGACTIGAVDFVNCEIRAFSAYSELASRAILVPTAPAARPVRFRDCTIVSTLAASPGAARSFGVEGRQPDCIQLIGGSIQTSDSNARQMDQFDIVNTQTTSPPPVSAYGARFSKTRGPVGSSQAQRVVVQRFASVAPANASAILPATALNPNNETIVSTGLAQPDAFRVLTVQGNAAGMSAPVIIQGADWSGAAIADLIVVSGATVVDGKKAFQTVTAIVLPAGPGSQTVTIGTSNRLGLTAPIAKSTDVQLAARRLAAGTDPFVFYALNMTDVDSSHSTIRADFGTLPGPAAFEFSYLGAS